jgi:gluconokinase
MGVSGTGKTTLGQLLTSALPQPARFIDADALHSPEAVAKMAAGHPLTDEDRHPWLLRVREAAVEALLGGGGTVVVGCSSLRRSYRALLTGDDGHTVWYVYIHASKKVLLSRMALRDSHHFMKATMLQSQLDTLEAPTVAELDGGLLATVDVGVLDPAAAVKSILHQMGLC